MRTFNSPEHESFRAVTRCMSVAFGQDATRRIRGLLGYMGVSCSSQLSPEGANYCRKLLERQLPECNA